jgi:hypothetical protein
MDVLLPLFIAPNRKYSFATRTPYARPVEVRHEANCQAKCRHHDTSGRTM